MKEAEKELLIAILKSNLSPQFKEEILRAMFMPRVEINYTSRKVEEE